jgi:trehalose utilization protein
MDSPLRVTIWNEFRHEKNKPEVAEIYPQGMHETIAAYLRRGGDLAVRTAWLDQPEQGCPQDLLDNTDVMAWWGHGAHQELRDDVVERVHERVLAGMGLLVLHSGHFSKIFKRLMGTTCNLKWRVSGERETFWVTRPGHPILEGIDDHFVLAREEMYGEYFDVPEPECTFLISNFAGGEVFRSGCTWTRGAGKIVYFRPGHETYPTYHDANVLRIIGNAVRWAAAPSGTTAASYGRREMGWVEK